MKLLPYWLSGDDEVCASCGQPYAHRAGKRCSSCDLEHCMVCIEIHENELLCIPCSALDVVVEKPAKKKRSLPWRRGRSGKAS